MSKCNPKNPVFINDCHTAAYKVLTAWVNSLDVRYDAGPYSKRDYTLSARHCFGTAYCDWSDSKDKLFNALKEVGAVNIIGKVYFNRIDIAFDEKQPRKKKEKES